MQRIHKRSAASHGEPGHCAVAFFLSDPVLVFYERHELLEEKIFVAPFSLEVIEETALPGIRVGHYNNHRSGRSVCNRFVGDVLNFSELDPSTVIVAATVQEIKHRIASLRRFVVGWKVNGIFPVTLQDLTREC